MRSIFKSVSVCLGYSDYSRNNCSGEAHSEHNSQDPGTGNAACKYWKMGSVFTSLNGKESPLSRVDRIKELGNTFPFSDKELEVLCRCHTGRTLSRGKRHCEGEGQKNSMKSEQQYETAPADGSSQNSLTFLAELSVCSRDHASKLERPQLEEHMNFIEQSILPQGFGSKLRLLVFENARSPSELLPGNNGSIDDCGLENFLDGVTRCCGRRGLRSTLDIMFTLACCKTSGGANSPSEPVETANAMDLVTMAYRLALASLFLGSVYTCSEDELNRFKGEVKQVDFADSSLVSLAASLRNAALRSAASINSGSASDRQGGDLISKQTFVEWAESTTPLLSAIFATFSHKLLFREMPFMPSRHPYVFPDLRGQNSAFFRKVFSPRLFSLACMSLSLGGTWHRLYTSDSDGLSFNRLQLALMGYGGPTVMLISATGGGLFGAFTSEPWKESKDFYGTSGCFLYQLEPSTGVFRPRGLEKNFMYCNSEARSKGYDALSHGIGFGGTTLAPRLFISELFEGNMASSRDMTFEPGSLLPLAANGQVQKYFDIDSLEVWGVGGDDVVTEALGARDKQREITDANIRRAKKVDKAQFLDDFQSGLFESKAFKHREEMRGRADCDLDV